ncbi:MAG: hypothetical protein KJN90_06490, partial [Gammaproteobacteria bacterium]|nr:hypothetical protein [Gammaproteobacteria bacterium]
IQHRGVGKWVNNDAGPDMQINPSRWRIKPEPREWTVTVTSHGITTNAGYSLDDETIKVREVIE